MLHGAIFLATCLATMTTEKYCKLHRGAVSHVRNISSQLATRPLEIGYNSFSVSLKSLASERHTLTASFSQNCFASCDWHATRSNLSRKVAKLLRIFLPFLQLATQHFVAVAGFKNGVLHVKFLLQLVSQRLLSRNVCCETSCRKNFLV